MRNGQESPSLSQLRETPCYSFREAHIKDKTPTRKKDFRQLFRFPFFPCPTKWNQTNRYSCSRGIVHSRYWSSLLAFFIPSRENGTRNHFFYYTGDTSGESTSRFARKLVKLIYRDWRELIAGYAELFALAGWNYDPRFMLSENVVEYSTDLRVKPVFARKAWKYSPSCSNHSPNVL